MALSVVLVMSSLVGAASVYAAQPETISVSENDVHMQTSVSVNDTMSGADDTEQLQEAVPEAARETEQEAVPETENVEGQQAAGDVAINATNFPNAAFRAYVSENADTDKNGVLSAQECAQVTDIFLENMPELDNVTGIEHFSMLESFYILGCNVEKLDFSWAPRLENLTIVDMPCFSEVNLSQNTQLRSLWIRQTRLRTMDISACTRLDELYCMDSLLKEIDLSNNSKLEYIDLSQNLLTELDVSSCARLKYLTCEENRIEELDVYMCPQLSSLRCADNRIGKLTLNPEMVYLYVGKNPLPKLDVTSCTKLRELSFQSELISELDLSNNPELTRLNCNDSGVRVLDLSANTKLKSLQCSQAQIAFLNLTDTTNLSATIFGNVHYVQGNTYDMSELVARGFDVNKISNPKGGQISDGILTFDEGSRCFSYTYQVSDTLSKEFRIVNDVGAITSITLDVSSIAPVVGETPKAYVCPKELPYTVTNGAWYEIVTLENYQIEKRAVTVFEAQKEYEYIYTIEPKEGYELYNISFCDIEGLRVSQQGKGTNVNEYYFRYKTSYVYGEDQAHEHEYEKTFYDCGDGTHAQSCELCGRKSQEKHLWGKGQVIKQATSCISDGATKYVCEECGASKTEAIKLAHTLTYTPAKAPTQDASGNPAYYKCSGCGKFFADKDGKSQISQAQISLQALKYNIKVGTKITDKKTNGVYKVTSDKNRTVTYTKPYSKKKTSYTIPSTIKYKGVTYKVTAISKNAFKNNKKIKKVTIGKYVTKIGANAFYKCKKLKTIVVKTSKLKKNTVGKKAISGIYKKAIIKVPKSKVKSYKKVFTSKTGYKKTMKIKK